jgi:solute carrier family 25 (mitochondrial phosphate transporter), member 23/24/25/41
MKETSLYQNMLIGGMSGVISRTITAPIELYKIQRQNYFLPDTTIKKTLEKEGILGLWKGNLLNCCRIFPTMAINYGILQTTKQYLENHHTTSNTTNMVVSSMISGVVSVIVMNPLETMRTRFTLQVKKSEYSSLYDGFRKTSIRELYYGTNVALMGYVPFNIISFTCYNSLKPRINEWIPKRENGNTNRLCKILTGGLTGIFAVSFTYPTDLLRRRLHIQGFSKSKVYESTFACVNDIYKKEGILGFYRGLTSAYLKLFPTIALQFGAIEYLNDYLDKEETENGEVK